MKARKVATSVQTVPQGWLYIQDGARHLSICEAYFRKLLARKEFNSRRFGNRVIVEKASLDSWKAKRGEIRKVGQPMPPKKAFHTSLVQLRRLANRLETAFTYTQEEPFGKAMAHLAAAVKLLETAEKELQ